MFLAGNISSMKQVCNCCVDQKTLLVLRALQTGLVTSPKDASKKQAQGLSLSLLTWSSAISEMYKRIWAETAFTSCYTHVINRARKNTTAKCSDCSISYNRKDASTPHWWLDASAWLPPLHVKLDFTDANYRFSVKICQCPKSFSDRLAVF